MSYVRNFKIEKILSDWKNECNLKYSIHYWYSNGILLICSSEVGKLIGYMGNKIYKYRNILKEQIRDFVEVKFQEVNHHWI